MLEFEFMNEVTERDAIDAIQQAAATDNLVVKYERPFHDNLHLVVDVHVNTANACRFTERVTESLRAKRLSCKAPYLTHTPVRSQLEGRIGFVPAQ